MSTSNQSKKPMHPEAAGQRQEAGSQTFDGNVVSISGDQLVMASKDGKEHTHTLKKDAKVTCDGSNCDPADLEVGDKIHVTTCKDDRTALIGVEALNKQANFIQTSA